MPDALRLAAMTDVPRLAAMTDVLRLAAFTTDPAGGNPAGVVLDASALSDTAMQAIAAEIGYAETAFVVRPRPEHGAADEPIGIRYFSPTAEVPFCGHATIATAVALADRTEESDPVFVFDTPVGAVRIVTGTGADGHITASFTSIEPTVTPIDDTVLDRLLGLIGRTRADLHPGYPPRLAAAGNTHPVVVLADLAAFDGFRFDPGAMRALMDEQGWAGTVTILYPLGPAASSGGRDEPSGGRGEPSGEPVSFEARNLFPVGTMDEDPATGSAAASVGGYLRALGLVDPPARVTVRQGRHVGRPGVLTVDVPVTGGIVVSGAAVPIREDGTTTNRASSPGPDPSTESEHR
jgi:PhzF family phenazine biosynthesis protein